MALAAYHELHADKYLTANDRHTSNWEFENAMGPLFEHATVNLLNSEHTKSDFSDITELRIYIIRAMSCIIEKFENSTANWTKTYVLLSLYKHWVMSARIIGESVL